MQSNEDVILEMVLCTGGASPLRLDVSGEARKDFSNERSTPPLSRRQMGQARAPENPIIEKEMVKWSGENHLQLTETLKLKSWRFYQMY